MALRGEPPTVSILAERLGVAVTGTWESAIAAGEAHIRRVTNAEVLASVVSALRFKPAHVFEIESSDPEVVLELGSALAVEGGALVLDSDAMELKPQRGSRRPAAKARPRKAAVDTTIPDEVRVILGAQQLYSLWGRRPPTVTFREIIRSMQPEPAGVGYPKPSLSKHWAKVGSLCLRGSQHGAGFALEFEYWHIKSVTPANWDAMLAVVCALARDTHGVLVRGGKEMALCDFSSDQPLPDDLGERAKGARIVLVR